MRSLPITPLYRALGRSAAERQEAYRELCREQLAPELLDAVRRATNGGWALGGERFQHEMAKAADRRVAPLARGPKRRGRGDKRQLILL
jgi:REP-associated tyrosine transposase